MIKTQGKAAYVVPAAPAASAAPEMTLTYQEPIRDMPLVEDAELEWKLCLAGIPAALALGVLFHFLMPGVQRIFFSMPVHELGHAASAWLCGHWAVPFLWKTAWGEERGLVTPLLLLGGFSFLIYLGWAKEQTILIVLGALGIAVQALGTLVLKPKVAISMIVFGGDGMGMVIATGLMASFFFGKDTQLYKGSLRWGFLVIGAAAFVDLSATWFASLSDFARVPFGEQEGGLLSDATRLVDEHDWETRAMIRRHVGVALSCLGALAAVYGWGVWQARAATITSSEAGRRSSRPA
ncbi:MAG TPA: hypothetical protein VI321_09240 [Burkholderiales bacterium]